eukprot:jgi/Psemu1/30560/gm1.30560_g
MTIAQPKYQVGTWDKVFSKTREALWVFFKRHWTCRLARIDVKDKTKENAGKENGDKTGDDNDPVSISNADDDKGNKDKDENENENDKGIGVETGGSEDDKDKTKENADKEVRNKPGDENNPVSSDSRNKSDDDNRHKVKDKNNNDNDKGIGVEMSGSVDKNKPKDNANEVVRDKKGDENNPVFNANGDDFYNNNNDKDNDKDNIGMEGGKAPHGWNKACKRCANKKCKNKCEQCQETCCICMGESCTLCCKTDEIYVRVPSKKRGGPSGLKNSNKMKSPQKKKGSKVEGAKDARLYSNSKQALMILVEKKRKEELIKKGIKLDDQTLERTLQEIAAIEDMTVDQLLYANNILKDDNGEKLPA